MSSIYKYIVRNSFVEVVIEHVEQVPFFNYPLGNTDTAKHVATFQTIENFSEVLDGQESYLIG